MPVQCEFQVKDECFFRITPDLGLAPAEGGGGAPRRSRAPGARAAGRWGLGGPHAAPELPRPFSPCDPKGQLPTSVDVNFGNYNALNSCNFVISIKIISLK